MTSGPRYRPSTLQTSDRQRRINPDLKTLSKTLAAVPTKARELPARRRRRGGDRSRSPAMGSDTEAENKRAPVALAPIAKPLAGKKLYKRTLKLIRRGLYGTFTLVAVGLMRFPLFRCDCLFFLQHLSVGAELEPTHENA